MKYMVEFRLRPGRKQNTVEAFELRGPNRNLGVSFHGAWIGKTADVAFVLVESADESLVSQVAQTWGDRAEFTIYSVIDVQQY